MNVAQVFIIHIWTMKEILCLGDFVPELFSNILSEDIKDIWDKMHLTLGKEKTYFYAKKCDKCNENGAT